MLAARELAIHEKNVQETLLQAEIVEDDPLPEFVKPTGNFPPVSHTGSSSSAQGANTSPAHAPPRLDFGNTAGPVPPHFLRQRVAFEVKELLARANLGQGSSAQDVDVEGLIEDCCVAVNEARARGVNLDDGGLSKEVMRTVLLGWDRQRRMGAEDETSPQPPFGEVAEPMFDAEVCVDEDGCLVMPGYVKESGSSCERCTIS